MNLLSQLFTFPQAHTTSSIAASATSTTPQPIMFNVLPFLLIAVGAALIAVFWLYTRQSRPTIDDNAASQDQSIIPKARNFSYTPVLVVILLIAAYYIGSLQTELKFRSNPSILGTQMTATVTAAPQATQAPTPTASIPPVTASDHIRGGTNPQVVLVEYSDLECPFCKAFHPTMQQAMADHGDKIAWVFREFPLTIHANAEKEAEGAECINELGGNDTFWKYVDTIYQRTTSNGYGFALDALGPLAAELGVDQTAFQNCLDSGKYAQQIQDSISQGAAAGVQGTPTTFILNRSGKVTVVPGEVSYDQLKQMIDQAIQSS